MPAAARAALNRPPELAAAAALPSLPPFWRIDAKLLADKLPADEQDVRIEREEDNKFDEQEFAEEIPMEEEEVDSGEDDDDDDDEEAEEEEATMAAAASRALASSRSFLPSGTFFGTP